MFSVNRIVALLTPVFTAGAGLATAYAAKHGLNLPASEVLTVEIAAATAAGGAALKWLHGHQQYEKIVADAEKVLTLIKSEEAIRGVPTAADSDHDVQVKNLQEQATEARAVAARAGQAQILAEQKAGEALTQLASVKAALNRVVPSEVQPTVSATVQGAPEQAQAS